MHRQGRQVRQDNGLSWREPGPEADGIARAVVDSALKVHKALGPGLLESAYQHCLAHELRGRGVPVTCEVPVPVFYGECRIDAGYRVDMIVGGCVLVENKSVERLLPIHLAQVVTYLRLSRIPIGFLLNWNVRLMRSGIRRVVVSPGAVPGETALEE